MSWSFPRLGALSGDLVRQNVFLMLTCLGAGVFIYLLTDLSDRLEAFLDAGLGARQILTYFMVKMPLIFSQILPAVFLLGGHARNEPTQRIGLRHGDVLVWGGEDRLRFHGVLPLKPGAHPLLGNLRINLTLRKAG